MPEPTPTPVPQPPEPPPSAIEYLVVSADGSVSPMPMEMSGALVVSPPANPNAPYWRIRRIEIQPETDKMGVYAILPPGTPFALQMYWADGQSEWAEPKADAYEPIGAREWAASQPVFRGGWGNFGIRLNVNAESLWGVGLYEKQGDVIIPSMTGHHPSLVYFERVEGVAPEEPEPEPELPEPPEEEPVEIPYTLEKRLAMAPYGFEDLRAAIRKISDVKALDATARRDAQGNPLFHLVEFIVVHNSGYDKPHTPMSTAQQAIAEGEPTIEYHFCIQGGKLFWTVPLVWVTNHTYQFNSRSIGVCVLGKYDDKDPAEKDLEALRFLIASLYEFLGQGWGKFRLVGLVPHRYVVKNATACPGRLWPAVFWSGLWPRLETPDAL